MQEETDSRLEISDTTEGVNIIDWIKKNCDEIGFLKENKTKDFKSYTSESKEPSLELIKKLDETELLHSPRNTEILMELWKTLLSDAIIFLKYRDKREKFHDGEVFGVNSLYKILKEFKEFEKVLYGTSENYRDHITHIFRVFILGERLIKESFEFNKISVYDDILIPKKRKGKRIIVSKYIVSPEEKEAMWCIIALTHDLGYALEKIDEINGKVRDMIKQYGKASIQELSFLFPPQSRAIDDFIIRFISSRLVKINRRDNFITHIQSKYYLKFYRAYEKFDHGIISCTVLMRELAFFLESDFLIDRYNFLNSEDARQFLIRQNILRSIAVHNCKDIYHLKGQNFPFLLTIIDEFQEWGRPRMKDIYKKNIPSTKVTINKFKFADPKKFEVDYLVTFGKNEAIKEKEEILKEIAKYFISKTQKFIKILRSAVGEERNIKLIFSVKDSISNTTFTLKLVETRADQLVTTILEGGSGTSLNEIRTKYDINN